MEPSVPHNASLSIAKSGSLSLITSELDASLSLEDRGNSRLGALQVVLPAVNALASCSPLHCARPAFEEGSAGAGARTWLDDSLFQGPDYCKFTLHCMLADISVQSASKNQEAVDPKVLQELQDSAASVSQGRTLLDLLHQIGADGTFPNLVALLSTGTAPAQRPSSSNTAMDYLDFINSLNQLMMMATQLHNDALDPRNHKYSAHQIALLYQTLNLLRGNTKAMRKRIEERFDEVKAITETASAPYLGAELQHWLQQITWDCRCMLLECPEFMHERMQCITDLIHR